MENGDFMPDFDEIITSWFCIGIFDTVTLKIDARDCSLGTFCIDTRTHYQTKTKVAVEIIKLSYTTQRVEYEDQLDADMRSTDETLTYIP